MREVRDGQPGPIATAARGKDAPGEVTKKSHPRRQRREKDHPIARVRHRRTRVALAPGDTLRPRCGVVDEHRYYIACQARQTLFLLARRVIILNES